MIFSHCLWAGPSNLLLFFGKSYGMSLPRLIYRNSGFISGESPQDKATHQDRTDPLSPTAHKQLNLTNHSVNEPRSRSSWGDLGQDRGLASLLMTLVEQLLPRFPIHRNCVVINMYCFKPLRFCCNFIVQPLITTTPHRPDTVLPGSLRP